MSEKDEYEVGYGKPPKKSQWQPGQSGNPKGRPKVIKDFDKLLDQELNQKIQITDKGELRTLTKREVVVKTLVNDALRGDRTAQNLVIKMMRGQQAVEGFEPDAADQEALLALFNRAKDEDERNSEASDE